MTHKNTNVHGRPFIPVSVHGKQGDDLAHHVQQSADMGDTVANAIRAWASELQESALDLRLLANPIEGSGEEPGVHVSAGAGCIEIEGVSEELAARALGSCQVVPEAITDSGGEDL